VIDTLLFISDEIQIQLLPTRDGASALRLAAICSRYQRVDLTAEVKVSSSIEKVGDARRRADQDERDAPKRGRRPAQDKVEDTKSAEHHRKRPQNSSQKKELGHECRFSPDQSRYAKNHRAPPKYLENSRLIEVLTPGLPSWRRYRSV
jgi:chromatin remodeling complex protein RSC6